jgi:hypothetical protein
MYPERGVVASDFEIDVDWPLRRDSPPKVIDRWRTPFAASRSKPVIPLPTLNKSYPSAWVRKVLISTEK